METINVSCGWKSGDLDLSRALNKRYVLFPGSFVWHEYEGQWDLIWRVPENITRVDLDIEERNIRAFIAGWDARGNHG